MLRPAIAASFCRKLYGAYSVTRYRLKLQSRRRRTDYEGPDGQRQEGAGGVAAGARHDVEQLIDRRRLACPETDVECVDRRERERVSEWRSPGDREQHASARRSTDRFTDRFTAGRFIPTVAPTFPVTSS